MTDAQRLVYADLRLALIIGMSRARLEAEWIGDEAQLARVMAFMATLRGWTPLDILSESNYR